VRLVLVAAAVVVVLAVLTWLWNATGVGRSQVERDFLADQQAIVEGLESGDSAKPSTAATGNALQDILNEIEANASLYLVQEKFDPVTTAVVQQVDPNDSTLTTAVEEKGRLTKTIMAKDGGAIARTDQLDIDDLFWMRQAEGGGRFLMADRKLSEYPASGPAITPATVGLIVAVVVLALALAVVAIRGRRHEPIPVLVQPVLPASQLAEPKLRVEILGRLRITFGDTDYTPLLLEREVLAYIWLYLLMLALLGQSRISRRTMASEVYPLLDASTQRQRFRGRLSNMRDLPVELLAPLVIDGDPIGFNLEKCRVDCLELGQLKELVRSRDAQAVAGAERLLRLGDALVMPEWDDLDKRVTQERSAGPERIKELRGYVEGRLEDLRSVVEPS
jgi:hypothetical protein